MVSCWLVVLGVHSRPRRNNLYVSLCFIYPAAQTNQTKQIYSCFSPSRVIVKWTNAYLEALIVFLWACVRRPEIINRSSSFPPGDICIIVISFFFKLHHCYQCIRRTLKRLNPSLPVVPSANTVLLQTFIEEVSHKLTVTEFYIRQNREWTHQARYLDLWQRHWRRAGAAASLAAVVFPVIFSRRCGSVLVKTLQRGSTEGREPGLQAKRAADGSTNWSHAQTRNYSSDIGAT